MEKIVSRLTEFQLSQCKRIQMKIFHRNDNNIRADGDRLTNIDIGRFRSGSREKCIV